MLNTNKKAKVLEHKEEEKESLNQITINKNG